MASDRAGTLLIHAQCRRKEYEDANTALVKKQDHMERKYAALKVQAETGARAQAVSYHSITQCHA